MIVKIPSQIKIKIQTHQERKEDQAEVNTEKYKVYIIMY